MMEAERRQRGQKSIVIVERLVRLQLRAMSCDRFDIGIKRDAGDMILRDEQTAIVTTNLPFSEWTTVILNARLCKALIDRITDRANIIETGTESYRFRRTLEKRKGKAPDAKS